MTDTALAAANQNLARREVQTRSYTYDGPGNRRRVREQTPAAMKPRPEKHRRSTPL
mgnify:CR=1 FL=1